MFTLPTTQYYHRSKACGVGCIRCKYCNRNIVSSIHTQLTTDIPLQLLLIFANRPGEGGIGVLMLAVITPIKTYTITVVDVAKRPGEGGIHVLMLLAVITPIKTYTTKERTLLFFFWPRGWGNGVFVFLIASQYVHIETKSQI